MTFCLRQLQEKSIEQNRQLYIVFVDFTKAFRIVGRTGLWKELKKYGCPDKFTSLVELLHTGIVASVSDGTNSSDSFESQMVSNRAVYLHLHSSPQSYHQCLKDKEMEPIQPVCFSQWFCWFLSRFSRLMSSDGRVLSSGVPILPSVHCRIPGMQRLVIPLTFSPTSGI